MISPSRYSSTPFHSQSGLTNAIESKNKQKKKNDTFLQNTLFFFELVKNGNQSQVVVLFFNVGS